MRRKLFEGGRNPPRFSPDLQVQNAACHARHRAGIASICQKHIVGSYATPTAGFRRQPATPGLPGLPAPRKETTLPQLIMQALLRVMINGSIFVATGLPAPLVDVSQWETFLF